MPHQTQLPSSNVSALTERNPSFVHEMFERSRAHTSFINAAEVINQLIHYTMVINMTGQLNNEWLGSFIKYTIKHLLILVLHM